jgi:ribosomal protein L37AE/L43A
MDEKSKINSYSTGIGARGSNITLDISGSITITNVKIGNSDSACYAIATNGTYSNDTITVNKGAQIACEEGWGIYAPATGSVTNILGGTISGATGIELRAGSLNITGGTITSTVTTIEDFGTQPNGSGTTVWGAAVAVSQHSTNKDTVATISGGELSGAYALYEEDLMDEKDRDKIKLTVQGGAFKGALHSQNCEKFVTGGVFSDEVDEKYRATGYESFQKADGSYSVCNHGADKSQVEFVAESDATCTEDGNVAYWHCFKCDTYFSDKDLTQEIALSATVAPKTGHEASKTGAVAPTCTEDGNVAYWHCSKCDTYFSDKDLTQEISLDDTVVAATKHEEASKTEAKAATCTEAGNVEYWYCPACGEYFSDKALTKQIAQADTVLADTAHANAAKVEAKAATETEDGNVTYWHCPDCGKYFSDETLTKEIAQADTVVPATGAAAPAPAEPTEPAPASPATPEPSEPEPETPAADEPSTPAADGAQAEPEAPATDEPAAPATDETGAPSDDGAAAAPAAGSSSSNAAAPSIVQTGDASGTAARAAALLAAVSGAAGALLLSLRRRVLSGKRAE